jgi:hypothetical protein
MASKGKKNSMKHRRVVVTRHGFQPMFVVLPIVSAVISKLEEG